MERKFSKGSPLTRETPPRNTGLLLRPKYKFSNIRIFYIYFRFLCEVDINDFRSNSIMRTNSSSILTRTKVSNNCIKGFGKVRARICVLQRQQAFRGVVIDFFLCLCFICFAFWNKRYFGSKWSSEVAKTGTLDPATSSEKHRTLSLNEIQNLEYQIFYILFHFSQKCDGW